MKKLITLITFTCISLPVFATPNNPSYPPAYFNNTNVPSYNWNNNRGSGMNMPNMNWGNNSSGFNNGSNWNMPNMNWGNNGGGSGFNMPNMNWGNGNGYNSGSSWNMPNMNWGSGNGYNSGSNWNMPNFNMNNNNQPWNYGNNRFGYGYNNPKYYIPYDQRRVPVMPAPPKFIPPVNPYQQPQASQEFDSNAAEATEQNNIPMPGEVSGVVLAPENNPVQSPETDKLPK